MVCHGWLEVDNSTCNSQHSSMILLLFLFVFAPDGTISICFYNARGNMHDSLVASFDEVDKNLAVLYQRYNVKVACDAVFGAVKHPFILKSHRPKNA